MLYDWRKAVTPRSLALWLLSTVDPAPMRAGALIDRAAIFGIDAPAMRVALGRLTREGMARQVERGVYAIGPQAAALHTRARSWAEVEKGVRGWSGEWILILTHHLGRTDRPRLQARERALRLGGFAKTAAGAWVRPDNLGRSSASLMEELQGLGLDDGASMLTGCTAQTGDDGAFRLLWPARELERGYRFWLEQMDESIGRIGAAAITEAARESYLLGQSVIRAINSDPLLPAELVDTDLRRDMVEAMKDYNAIALGFWEQMP